MARLGRAYAAKPLIRAALIGAVVITGSATITQADNSCSSTATVLVTGSATITQAAESSSSAGLVLVQGSATITQASETLSSAGTVGSTYTSTQTGNWSSASTWGGNGPPGAGDRAIVATTHVVTVDVNTTIGYSPAAGNDAVTVQGTGQIIVAASKTFVVRGDMGVHCNGLTAGIKLSAGSTLEFDASGASSPSTTRYSLYGTSGGGSLVLLEANGSAGSHCVVRSNASGGVAIITGEAVTQAGGIIATYTDFLRIGDATHPGFVPYFFTDSVKWDVQNCTFTTCGPINSGGSPAGTSVVKHNNNVHTGSLGNYNLFINFGTKTGGGAHEIIGNVFDLPVGSNGSSTGYAEAATITGNYFGGSVWFVSPVGSAGANNWTLFQNNLVRGGVTPLGSVSYSIAGDVLDNYIFVDSYAELHAHFPDTYTENANVSFLRNLMDASYIDVDVVDESDGIVTNNSSTSQTLTVKNNIVMPCGSGRGCTSLIGYRYLDMPFVAFVVEHNTAIPAADVLELAGANDAAGSSAGTIKNNIFWDSVANRGPIANDTTHGAGATPTIQTDIFPPAAILNNCQHNMLATVPGKSFLTNQGNGYSAKWSVTPGSSDLYVDPQFNDVTRNIPTWDTAYLGNSASATWASKSSGYTFAVGDIISDHDSSFYGDVVINYRCIASHTKNTSNSQPGIGSAFHTYWEFASLYSIRIAMAAGTTYAGDAPIVAIMRWVRNGFAPKNQTLKAAGTDSVDVGAVLVMSTGTATITQASNSCSSTATVLVQGSAAITQASETISCAGVVLVQGSAAITQASGSCSSNGTVLVQGTLTKTQDSQTLSATGVGSGVVGTLTITQASETLVSAGTVGATTTGPGIFRTGGNGTPGIFQNTQGAPGIFKT